MTLDELIAQYRGDTDDKVKPYLVSDEDVTRFLNEAEEEAALRANLLFESDDPAMCEFSVAAGDRAGFELHELVFTVVRATFTPAGSTEPCPLDIRGRLTADVARPQRRNVTDKPRALIVDDTRFELDCIADSDGVIDLEVYRAPLRKMTKGKDSPEIGRAHHRFLTKWAEHRVFGRPDAEMFDATRSAAAEEAFTQQFGIRPDADLRRALQADAPPHNVGYY